MSTTIPTGTSPDRPPLDYSFAELERINEDPIIVTVAGHANHGKTSIVRTFTRDRKFGEVRDEPGVTRDIGCTLFRLHGKTYLKLYDTPGFQYSSLAIETCGETARIEQFEEFFQSDEKYRHDRIALAQARKSHVILYVIDVSQAPSERLRDDFHILSKCLVPVLPLFNFVASKSSDHEREWKDTLRRFNYHEFTRYDAHHYNPHHEQQLYKRMVEKLDDDPLHRKFLQWRMADSRRRDEELAAQARRAVAEMLVDCAAYRQTATGVTKETRGDVEKIVLDEFRKTIQDREFKAFERILSVYDIEPHRLHNQGDAGKTVPLWTREVFGPQSMRDFGMGVGGGATSGALIGGTIDAFVGGASFGAGAAIGGVIGGLAGFFGTALHTRKFDEETGTVTIQSDRDMWRMLAGRSTALLHDVQSCGAASEAEFEVTTKPPKFPRKVLQELYAILSEVADQPRFAEHAIGQMLSRALGPRIQEKRDEAVARVEDWLRQHVHEAEPDTAGQNGSTI
jgi:GTP-binding protein EngB required for normal cell division